MYISPSRNPIQHLLALEAAGNRVRLSYENSLYLLLQDLEEQSSEQQLLTNSALRDAREAAYWSTFNKATTVLSASSATICGLQMMGAAPFMGPLLVISGTVAIANLILKESQGWVALAEAVAPQNCSLQEGIAHSLPHLIDGVTTTVNSLGVGGATLWWRADVGARITTAIQNSSTLANGVTAFGSARTRYHKLTLEATLDTMRFERSQTYRAFPQTLKEYNKFQEVLGETTNQANSGLRLQQQACRAILSNT